MEHNHGQIEHERNLNQGKRPNQYEKAAKIWFVANLILLIGLLIYGFFWGKGY